MSYRWFVTKQHPFYVSLGHATQQQKPHSDPEFGAFKADVPTCVLIRRSVLFTDAGMICMSWVAEYQRLWQVAVKVPRGLATFEQTTELDKWC